MEFLLDFLNNLTLIHADDDADPRAILFAAGPLAAFAFYSATYRRYRNFDKRFKIEDSTEVSSAKIDSTDIFIKSVKGASESSKRDRNDKDPTIRVGRHS